MTATDELRAMLDKRGVEYRAIGDATFWETHDGAFRYKAEPHAEKLTVMTCCSQKCTVMTPAQAIAATLGAGTCRDVADTPQYGDKTRFECSECGYEYSAVGGFGCDYGDEPDFRFCPNCGRKVVDE